MEETAIPPEVYQFGPYRLDSCSRSLWRGAEPIPLTGREFGTLRRIASGLGEPVSKDEILEEFEKGATESNVTTQVRVLRKKLAKMMRVRNTFATFRVRATS